MNLPRVLIIGQTFNTITGGGITQTNLFNGWDKDKIAVAGTPHSLNNSDMGICANYYQLGENEHKWVFPFNYLQRKFYSGIIQFKEENIYTNLKVKKFTIRSKIVDNFFLPFLKYSGLIHCISKIELSPGFCKWLKEFSPDVIYAQGQDRERILFSLLLHSYLRKPLIFHVMDDWPSSISNKGPFQNYWHKIIDRDFRALLNKATLLLSISDAMADEYKTRYKKDFITFHNPISVDFWKKYQKINYELSEPPTILYAGRMGLGIQSSLEIIAKAIQLTNEELNMSIKFAIQTAEKPIWANNYSCVEHKHFVTYHDLPRIFSEADFLILPYDFSIESIKYIQYSMPTKAPEYMMSGTPIIVFAPETTAIVKYAQKYEWAKIVAMNNAQRLSIAIKDLIQNKALREKIGHNAKIIAEGKHNLISVSNKFKRMIIALAPKA